MELLQNREGVFETINGRNVLKKFIYPVQTTAKKKGEDSASSAASRTATLTCKGTRRGEG